MNRATIGVTAMLLCASAASAQQNTNQRGTVTAFDGKAISVATRDGTALEVLLPDGVNVSGTQAFTLADLKPGTHADIKVGETVFIAARPDAEGRLSAVRVQVSTNGVKPTQ